MVKRSRLNLPVMKFCIVFAATVDFEYAPPQLLEIVTALMSGWLQSRINEKGAKVIRDAETRDNASKVSFLCFL